MKILCAVLLGLPVVAVVSDTGAPDERPIHHVSGSAFLMDRYEVTNARYAACVQAGACAAPAPTEGTMSVVDGKRYRDCIGGKV
jgi:formylglycine-generating enzyme required for sulfatase activity